MANGCEGCTKKGDETLKPTPEQIKAFIKMQREAQETQKAFMKDIKPLNKKSTDLFMAMRKCKKCKESKYKFVPCPEHLATLKSLGEKMAEIKMYYGLKQQFAKLQQEFAK